MGKHLVIASRPFDMFARGPRITRAHPTRDPEGHSKKKPVPTITDDDDDDDDNKPPAKKAPAGETPEQKVAREAQEQLAETRNLSAWLLAERDHQLHELEEKHLTAEEKEQRRMIREGSSEAVASATAPLLQQIAKMRSDAVDGAIESALAENNLKPADVEHVIATLDKSKFLDEDGSVKRDFVKQWAGTLGSASTKLPPRTKNHKVTSGSAGNGFGRYLED